MISILFFFVKRARKLPFQIFYGSSHVYIRLETIRSPNIFPSDECLPIKLWFINRSTHFPNIPQELPKQIFICHLFAYRGQHPIVSFQNSIFFSPPLSLSNPFINHLSIFGKAYGKILSRAIFKLYPSILCLEEKRFRLQAETVSGRLLWRLSRAGCIIHVFQAWIYMGIVPATLVYIVVDLQSRLLAAFPFVAEHRWFVPGFSREFFFPSNEVYWNSWKRSEYRIMNRWSVIRWGYWVNKYLNKVSSYL